jgi:anti-sigma factor RsiW
MAEEIRDCGLIEARLTPYLDGEESPSMRESIAAHLAACPPCRHIADLESTARQMVHAHRADLKTVCPDALRHRCAKLSGAGATSTFVRRWMPLSLAATVVLAVSAAFLYSVNNPMEALAASLAVDHTACFTFASTNPNTDPSAPPPDGSSRKAGRSASRWRSRRTTSNSSAFVTATRPTVQPRT